MTGPIPTPGISRLALLGRLRALAPRCSATGQLRAGVSLGVATDGDSTTVEALLEGKSLIFRMLGKTLGEHGLEEVSPLGEVFDPEQHEAMTMQPSEEYPENTVMKVLQKGFRLHDRLLRPAMVVVSRGSVED